MNELQEFEANWFRKQKHFAEGLHHLVMLATDIARGRKDEEALTMFKLVYATLLTLYDDALYSSHAVELN